MVDHGETERVFSHELAREFVGNGYQQVEPNSVRNELPAGYMPDLIFRRGKEVVVVELKSAAVHVPLERLRSLKEAIEQRPNWQFKLYVIPAEKEKAALHENLEDANRLLKRARRLNQDREYEAASVVLWMAIETALRTLLTNRQSRPNLGISGLSMARSLMSVGELSDEEVSLINRASKMRNTAVHGYRLEPREPLGSEIIKLAQDLAQKAQSEAASA